MTECFVARRGKTADLQAELGRRGIKFQVLKEKPLLERRVAKDALALLQLALNLHDDLAFQRILARPAKHLGRVLSCALDWPEHLQQHWLLITPKVQPCPLVLMCCQSCVLVLLCCCTVSLCCPQAHMSS